MQECSFCKKQYKLYYINTHIERVHTDRDNPKYVKQREKASLHQKTLSAEYKRQRAQRYCDRHRDRINRKRREMYDLHHDKFRAYYDNYYQQKAEQLAAYYRQNADKFRERRQELRKRRTQLCTRCNTLYNIEGIERHKQGCLGSSPAPIKFKIIPKPKELPKMVNMTIKFFDGTSISGTTHFGYHSI